ncbi:MAG: RES domain-containing protein [Chloroflexota bacterium]
MRHLPHGADPRFRPQPPDDNRWQRGVVVDALYLARDETTLWAEWYRHLAERGVPPLKQLPRDVWRLCVPPLRIADVSAEQRLGRAGLAFPMPGRRTWQPYQGLGETLWREGWNGLLAPSAAHPAGRILCLFIDDPLALPAEPLPPPAVVSEPPVPPTGMRT